MKEEVEEEVWQVDRFGQCVEVLECHIKWVGLYSGEWGFSEGFGKGCGMIKGSFQNMNQLMGYSILELIETRGRRTS